MSASVESPLRLIALCKLFFINGLEAEREQGQGEDATINTAQYTLGSSRFIMPKVLQRSDHFNVPLYGIKVERSTLPLLLILGHSAHQFLT